jgi:hypothetical protein
LRGGSRRREIARVKSHPMNLERSFGVVPTSTSGFQTSGRFLVIVEYAAGVCVTTAVAESAEGAVKAFSIQGPACAEGEISLFDRSQQRVVASVKWKMSGTEIGLPVPHRLNVFYEWYLALIALELQRRRAVPTSIELGD